MQPDVQEKDEPAGGSYRSIGVAAASEVCPIQEENSSLPTAQPGERQSDLIIDDPRKSRKWRLDPGWKPSWAEWLKWKGWRRVTNDRRLSDSGHRLWFYLYDTKDNDGIIEGDRADASFIAAKFGWRRQKVYQLLEKHAGMWVCHDQKAVRMLLSIETSLRRKRASQRTRPARPAFPDSDGCQEFGFGHTWGI